MSDVEEFIKDRLIAELEDVQEKIEDSNYDGFIDEPEEIDRVFEKLKNYIKNFECAGD
jgi:hypothetical protein